jgi:hypothetical protein
MDHAHQQVFAELGNIIMTYLASALAQLHCQFLSPSKSNIYLGKLLEDRKNTL